MARLTTGSPIPSREHVRAGPAVPRGSTRMPSRPQASPSLALGAHHAVEAPPQVHRRYREVARQHRTGKRARPPARRRRSSRRRRRPVHARGRRAPCSAPISTVQKRMGFLKPPSSSRRGRHRPRADRSSPRPGRPPPPPPARRPPSRPRRRRVSGIGDVPDIHETRTFIRATTQWLRETHVVVDQSRMSVTPEANISVRSTPIPNANPLQRSGSYPGGAAPAGAPSRTAPNLDPARSTPGALAPDVELQVGSVKGKYEGRQRVRRGPNSAWANVPAPP